MRKGKQVVPKNRVAYRPEQEVCPLCQGKLRRSHIVWRKALIFSSGSQQVTSWAYRCPTSACANAQEDFRSVQAEKLHLRQRRFSRELIVRIGYQHFWQHQTMYEIHAWLTQDLQVAICARQVANLLADFLALLGAAQPAQIRRKLKGVSGLLIGVDGMQPEKGNDCLYIVRELPSGTTLLAKHLTESTQTALCEQVFAPLTELAQALGVGWQGVVSDAQETLRLAIAHSLPGVAHQACQAHCLRAAGQLTFEADRATKKQLKACFRRSLPRLRKRVQLLPPTDPFRPILLDYVQALRSLLLEGGVAPFELGGVNIFGALEALAASVSRCQKKAITHSYVVWVACANVVSPLPRKWSAIAANANGCLTWNSCSIQNTTHRKPVPVSDKPWHTIWRNYPCATHTMPKTRPLFNRSSKSSTVLPGVSSPATTYRNCHARIISWKGSFAK